jgi:phenylacetate-CoA ligase
MTSLAEERREQQRWTDRLSRTDPSYDKLIEHEFATPEQDSARMAQNLGAILRFASRHVPHYRDVFRRAHVDANDDPFQVLAALPVLTKLGVHDAGRALLADNLPPGDEPMQWWETSGTTGRPIRVLHSKLSLTMYTRLAQRGARWHRLDPSGTFAEMRLPKLLPRLTDGREVGPGETARLKSWRHMPDFATGPYLGVSIMTPVDERIGWLRREHPNYLLAYSSSLEILAFALSGEPPLESLRGLIAMAEQLTPGMRSLIERRFGVPIHQSYGLSEIGIVAVRCEAGRYHIHREHCLVEIVDEEGRACAPGQIGRILVTALRNFAMPLVRYDTGDLAEVAIGDCPCKRTLPSFGDVVGRYGRFAFVPAGTIHLVLALRTGIETMPDNLVRDLREFQIHQYADKRMELRLLARAPLPEGFYAHVRGEWAKAAGPSGPELAIVHVDELMKLGEKSEVFTSDFIPGRDGRPAIASLSGAGAPGAE